MKRSPLFLWLLLLSACQSASQPVTQLTDEVGDETATVPKKTYLNYGIQLKRLLDSLGWSPTSVDMLILKGEYELVLMRDTVRIKSYPVVFGGNPKDDKLRQGDQCTPEGIFAMRGKYPHKSWTKFIWIDYPNAESRKKHKAAKATGQIPADAAIGGDVGIHGINKGLDDFIEARSNWTLGCISMKNADVNEIYSFITEKTRIEIRK